MIWDTLITLDTLKPKHYWVVIVYFTKDLFLYQNIRLNWPEVEMFMNQICFDRHLAVFWIDGFFVSHCNGWNSGFQYSCILFSLNFEDF